MSRLRVYWPESSQGEHRAHFDNGGPVTLSFESFAEDRDHWSVANLVSRARSLHRNNRCPHCSHPVVEPLELADAALSRNRRPIPGTGTLVGYRCQRCYSEWPA